MSTPSPSPPARGASLDLLGRAASAGEWERCAELCFRVLHGLPAAAQLAAATAALRAALPPGEPGRAEAGWHRRLLDDPAAWVAAHGRETPDPPEPAAPGDAELAFALDALLVGAAHPDDARVLAAACASAVRAAVDARAAAAWAGDDPAAVEAWRRVADAGDAGDGEAMANALAALEGAGVTESGAAGRARAAAWTDAAAALEAAGVRGHPGPDPTLVEHDLEAWREHELSPIVPGPPNGTPT
jgi:hypothetical protein